MCIALTSKSPGRMSVHSSEPGPHLPQLGEETAVDGGAQVLDTGGAPGSRAGADGAGGHERVTEPPGADRLVVVAEKLGDGVEDAALRAHGVVAVECGEC